MAAACRSSRPIRSGRVTGARLEPQPDDAVPRFDYERHVRALVDERVWPDSTRQISELRLTIEYEFGLVPQPAPSAAARIHLDIVDYPGEWLLDLPLLAKDYADLVARDRHRGADARPAASSRRAGSARLAEVNPAAPEDEALARELAALFTDYLRAIRADGTSLSTMPPGPLPDARRPRRLAGADLLAARPRRWRDPARLARRDDGAALRGL